MNREYVYSSNLASVGYEAISQILEVEFRNGAVYRYFNVPVYEWRSLMQASSHGRYFTTQIKGHYRYTKL